MDGGLIANNPTLDVLTEIFEHNLALRTVGRASEAVAPTAVLSLGCGRPPVVEVSEGRKEGQGMGQVSCGPGIGWELRPVGNV